ncbi:MAG: hypothetical protein GEU83_10220 [Pseudonocardiaceae bacterium]|nr:hypothetical protein [Pseudonocardiaceae bacterium]
MLLPPERRRSLLDTRVVAAYLAGTLCGAMLTALVAWVLSGFTEPLTDLARLALLGAGGGLLWAAKHGLLRGVLRLPEARRQIPAEVFGANLVRGAYGFGFELATGVRTYVPSAAPYVLLLTVLLIRPPLGIALLMGAGFGAARAAPLLLRLVTTRTGAAPRGTARLAATPATMIVLLGGLTLV